MHLLHLAEITILALSIHCFPDSDLFDNIDLNLFSMNDLQSSDPVGFMMDDLGLYTFDQSDQTPTETVSFDDKLPGDQLLFASADCSQPISKRLPEQEPAVCRNNDPAVPYIPKPLLRPSWRTKDPKLVPLKADQTICPLYDPRLDFLVYLFCDSGRSKDRIFNPGYNYYDLVHATPCKFLTVFFFSI